MRIIGVLVAMWLGGCATTSQAYNLHDTAAGQELEAFVREGFRDMDNGSTRFWKDKACPMAVAWDTDEQGQPTRASGKAEVDAMLDGYQQMMDKGTKVHTTIQTVTCRSSTDVGHCLVEFDQTFTTKGKTQGPLKFRATAIMERIKGRWIWTHWHSSLREMPTGH